MWESLWDELLSEEARVLPGDLAQVVMMRSRRRRARAARGGRAAGRGPVSAAAPRAGGPVAEAAPGLRACRARTSGPLRAGLVAR